MQVSSNGIGVGLAKGSNPNYLLELGLDSAFKPNTATWSYASDRRLKKDIDSVDLNTCYEIVKAIPLKSFRWIEEDVYVRAAFIAQDIEVVLPEAIKERSYGGFTDCKTINMDPLFNQLFGCVKHMQRRIEELERINKT